MKYCESRVFENGTRQTYVAYEDRNLLITECPESTHTEIIPTYYDPNFKPDPPENFGDNFVISKQYGAPIAIRVKNFPKNMCIITKDVL